MPVSRTAASLSLTIGVAMATLLVAGGILAGPSIVQCGRDGAAFGACLRAKAIEAGILHQKAADPDTTASRADGWIAADATEYVAPPPASANLAAADGAVTADGGALSIPAPSGRSEVVAAPGALTATASLPSAASPAEAALARPPAPDGQGALSATGPAGASVVLLAPPGALAAAGTAPPAAPVSAPSTAIDIAPGTLTAEQSALPLPAAEGQSAMVATRGDLSIAGSTPSGAPGAVVALSPVLGQISASGAIPSAPPPVGSDLHAPQPLPAPALTLEAELPAISSIEEVVPQPVPLVPKVAVPRPKVPPRRAASIVEKPTPTIRPIPKYNPRYPNVIVLPPPNTGADSSITTLELR